jgi:hypothetical protein
LYVNPKSEQQKLKGVGGIPGEARTAPNEKAVFEEVETFYH